MANPIKRLNSPLNNEKWYNKIMPDFIKNWNTDQPNNPTLDLEKVASTRRTWQPKSWSRRHNTYTPHLTDEQVANAPKNIIPHPISGKPVDVSNPFIKTRQIEDPRTGGMKDQVVNTQGGSGNRVDYIPTLESYEGGNYNISGQPHNQKLHPKVHQLGREMTRDSLNLVNRGMGGEAVNRYGDNLGAELRGATTPGDFSKVVHGVLSNDGTDFYEGARNFVRRGGSGFGSNVATNRSHVDFSNEPSSGSTLTRPNKMNELITKMYNWYTGGR